jgi:four helix bundle protein
VEKNVIKTKSFEFAVDIVHLYKELISNHKEYEMSRQLLKSGTSIGANVQEAEFAVSKPDFINKMSIGLKEANETEYWLDLLNRTTFIDENTYIEYKPKIQELIKLLVSIVKSSKL